MKLIKLVYFASIFSILSSCIFFYFTMKEVFKIHDNLSEMKSNEIKPLDCACFRYDPQKDSFEEYE